MKNVLSFKKVKLVFVFVLCLITILSAIILFNSQRLKTANAAGESYLKYNLINGGNAYEVLGQNLNYNGPSAIDIPSTYNGKPVTKIADNAFRSMEYIPFSGYYNNQIANITIPNSITSIGNSAFYWCSSLTSIIIPSSVTSIGELAFSGCSKLTNVTIPSSVTNIGNGIFSHCSSLTSITIYGSVTSIGSDAFSSCSSLTSIIIPSSVTSVGNYAFSNCSSLTNIAIPNSVKSIGDWAFTNCKSLTDVTIPDSVTNIGGRVFSYCSKLKNINVSANNALYSSLNGVLFNKDKTVLICYPEGKEGSYQIPDSVTNIGSYAFYYCSKLTNIIIPDSVKNIENSAFYNCSSLTSIIIPESVTNIGDSAFIYCSSLTTLNVCRKSSQNITLAETDFLHSTNSGLTVYVPFGSVDAYKNASNWEKYKIQAAETNAPVISGAADKGNYLNVQIKIVDESGIKSITLNNKKVESSYGVLEFVFTVSDFGDNELIAEDIWGNYKKINFSIDIYGGLYYKAADNNYYLLDKEKLESGEKVWLSSMSFKLDGHIDYTFKIDDIAQALTISGGSSYLNASVALGKHTLTIVSKSGTTFNFEFYINPNNPGIKGVSDNGRYESGSNNLISFTDDGDKYYDTSGSSIKSVKLFNNNSVEFKLIDTFGKEAGYPFSSDYLLPATAGKYTLTVTNMAGNVTQISFTITISIPPEEPINASANLTLTGTSKNGVTKGSAAIVWNINSSVTVNATIDDIKFNYKNGDILTVSGRYIIVVDDGICKETFEFILDNDVSYTCNIGNGAITNENVIINCVESLTIVLTKNYQKINYEFGQEITEDGNYTAIIKDALGNSIEFNFTIIKKAKTGFSFTCPDDHEIVRYVKNGVEQSLPANTLFLNFDSDGTYLITVKNKLTQETYTYTLTIDTIPPELSLTNIKNGIAANSVKMQSVSKQNVTIIVKKDGIAIDAGLGTVLRENGVYTIEVTDEIGNVNTYNFTIDKHPDWMVMVISLAAGIALVAVFGVLGHLRRKKSFKSI